VSGYQVRNSFIVTNRSWGFNAVYFQEGAHGYTLSSPSRSCPRCACTAFDPRANQDHLGCAAVRGTLRAEPFDISNTNRALKEAVSKIVINPEAGSLAIHWRHADDPQEGLFLAYPLSQSGRVRRRESAKLERHHK